MQKLQTPEIAIKDGRKIVRLHWQHPKERWDEFLGERLGEDAYDLLIEEDADIYTPEGDLLCVFRKKALNAAACKAAFLELRKINQTTQNRGMATGKHLMGPRERADGSLSQTNVVPKGFAVVSNILGYFDRYVRIPYCRQTAFNANNPEGFKRVLPFIQSCSQVYQEHAQERWAKQKAVIDRTHPDFVIPGSVFTTITVNKNFRTAVHTDKGDLKDGLSLITALCGGQFTGGNLVFPHYRVAANLRTADLLMFDSHHMHGNTPILGKVNAYERVSLVLYYREKMRHCKSAAEELAIVANRKPGDPLYAEEPEYVGED